ncbi:hypothetical protein MRB53_036062 [Persea americana]|uniref:Uncharacterized protein n=1 Tax=Persea americana TaxID=3435 RepID=A0ACC2K6D2_PERAE|nr:hypothetical protein MRB53_036062 [Persea americana]
MAEEDPTKIPVGQPRYGTFSHQHPIQPSAPFLQPGTSTMPPSSTFYQNPQSQYYHPIPVGYQAYGAVVEGIPVREHQIREPRLPCCGIGIGWMLFLAGFFFAAVPWYVGAFILLFVGVDYREKAGLLACTIGAILVAITVTFGLSKENLDW